MKKKLPSIEFRPHCETTVGVEVIELESLYSRADELEFNLFSPHRVNFYHLIYIAKGTGKHFIDFNHYPYQSGSFIFVNSQQVHAFELASQPKGKLIIFTQKFVELVQTNIRIPFFSAGFHPLTDLPIITVTNEIRVSCEAMLTEICNVNGDQLYDSLIFQSLFTALILKLHQNRSGSFPHHIGEKRRQQFSIFRNLIEENFTSVREAKFYANLMNMTYKSLNQLCKSAANQTPKQIIDSHIILELKRKLVIDEVAISQLAQEFGFDEVSNFDKFFKKHTLMTPSQFQKNYQVKD